jgi:hypothetical protein
MKRLPAVLLVVFIAAAACGHDGAATTSSTSSIDTLTSTSASTISISITTTTEDGIPSPINGLPVADPGLLDRRVIAVKVDNHPDARPQSGLQEADAVLEYLAEGGIGRFVALFHHSDSEYLGPVRSIRPTDSTILSRFDATLVISGGAPWVQNLTVGNGVSLMGEGVSGLFRVSHRSAPHNLYANTAVLRENADDYGFDDEFAGALYKIEEWETLPAEEAKRITLDWAPYNTVVWVYENGTYRRYEGDREHEWIDLDGNRGQLAFDVLIIIEGNQYIAYPPPGVTTHALPSIETVGSGGVYILSEGRVLQGTWERAGITEEFLFYDNQGNAVAVPPGVPWVSFFPAGRSISLS